MQNLTPFHTFHLPVKASKIIEYTNVEQLLTAWQTATHANQPILLLGRGSNVLFTDDFHGVVLVNKMQGIEQREDADFHYLHVQGGQNWHELVKTALSLGIYGLENLALIPGVAGSAPIQNIGAYGVEFANVCDFVDVVHLSTGERSHLSKEACRFGYRDSIFKHEYKDEYAIIAVGLKKLPALPNSSGFGNLLERTAHTSSNTC